MGRTDANAPSAVPIALDNGHSAVRILPVAVAAKAAADARGCQLRAYYASLAAR